MLLVDIAVVLGYYYSPTAWNVFRVWSIERSQEKIQALVRSFKKGEVDERNRKDVTEMSFGVVSWFLGYT